MEKLENLKKELKLKLNEHTMFNNTLAEMVEKNSSITAIKQMEDEINKLEKEIKKLQEEIRINLPKKNDNSSFYNHIKKPTLAKSVKINPNIKDDEDDESFEKDEKYVAKTSFYDSVKKNDFAPYDAPYNSFDENSLKYKELYEKACSFLKDKKFPLVSAYDDVISTNRFLVRFEGNTNVPEWYVRKVTFSPSDVKEIYIQIFDFLTEDNRPIITEFNNPNISFRISIDHLSPTGVVLYTERYHGCHVIEIMKSDLAYNLDEKSTMELRITYSDVTYETAH